MAISLDVALTRQFGAIVARQEAAIENVSKITGACRKGFSRIVEYYQEAVLADKAFQRFDRQIVALEVETEGLGKRIALLKERFKGGSRQRTKDRKASVLEDVPALIEKLTKMLAELKELSSLKKAAKAKYDRAMGAKEKEANALGDAVTALATEVEGALDY